MTKKSLFLVAPLVPLTVALCLLAVVPVSASPTNPIGIFLSPDGSRLYAPNTDADTLAIISTGSDTVANSLPLPSGWQVRDLAFSPDGARAFVVNQTDNSVTVIATDTETVTNTITVGAEPQKIIFTPDSSKAYVANRGDDSVSVIDTLTETVTGTVTVGGAPVNLVVTTDGGKVYVANSEQNSISIIDTLTDTVSSTISFDPVDVTPPELLSIVLTDAELSTNETSLVTFTFSESVGATFDHNDITTVDNGTLSEVIDSGDGTVWTATLTPDVEIADATNVITVTLEGITDLADNAGAGTVSSDNYLVDTVDHNFTALIVGDSNARSTRIDTLWAGDPVQSGFALIDSGVQITNYPTGTSPGVSMVPYLVEQAIAAGKTNGWVVRRGINGATSQSYMGIPWTEAKADVTTLANGTPDVVVFVLGVNDGNGYRTQAQAEAYDDNMLAMINDAKTLWPEAQILLTKEAMSAASATTTYTWMNPIIYPAIDWLGANGHATVVDGTDCSRVDGVHWSVYGTGPTPTSPGTECVANRIAQVLWPE